MLRAFGLTVIGGAVHLLLAVPAGVALGLSAVGSALAAWLGYVAVAVLVLFVGQPLRAWVIRRFRIRLEPDPEKLFWRAWNRGGMAALGLVAPFSCGPYIAVIIGLALGESAHRALFWVAVGVIPTLVVLVGLILGGQSVFATG